MMAAGGDNSIDYWYPALDSWHAAGDLKGYIHNTSGARKERLPRGEQLYDTAPQSGEPAAGDYEPAAAAT